jgi:hypothetical protein
MRRFVKESLLVLLLIQAGIVNVVAQARDSEDSFASLVLAAEPEKSVFTLGEPLRIRMQLENPTQSDITIGRDLDPVYGAIQVYISRNGEEFKRYLGPGWGTKDRFLHETSQISPGEVLKSEITVLFHNSIDGRDDLFDSSLPINGVGTYRIRVELYDDSFRRKLTAPLTNVEVGFSPASAEYAISQAVVDDKDGALAFFLQTGDTPQPEVVEKAEQLIERFSGNDQQKRMALAIGNYHLRHDKVETAIGFLNEAAKAEYSPALRDRALLELAKSYIKRGDIDEALKISNGSDGKFSAPEIEAEFEGIRSKLRQAERSLRSGKSGP